MDICWTGDGTVGGKFTGNGRCCDIPLRDDAVSDTSVHESDLEDCAEMIESGWSDVRRDELGECVAFQCCCSGDG